MTIVDQFYCAGVANSDSAAACERWLQAGRDHRWAPPAPATFDWVGWVPALAAVVSVVAVLLMVRGLRRTRKPAAVRPGVPRPVAVARQVTVADTRVYDRTVPAQEARTDAHSVSPGW